MEYTVPKRDGKSQVDARVRRSRAELRTALLGLLETRPYDEISIRDLTAAAGVGYTTFFRHYPGKEALLDDLVADEIAGLTAFTAPVYAAENSRAACVALCRYVDQHRSLWRALLTGGAAGVVRDELLRQGRAAAVDHAARSPLPPDLGVALATAVMIELLGWWLRQETPWPVEHVADVLDRTAIAPRPAGGG